MNYLLLPFAIATIKNKNIMTWQVPVLGRAPHFLDASAAYY